MGAMIDARWERFAAARVTAGVYPPGLDAKRAYSVQFVDRKVGRMAAVSLGKVGKAVQGRSCQYRVGSMGRYWAWRGWVVNSPATGLVPASGLGTIRPPDAH